MAKILTNACLCEGRAGSVVHFVDEDLKPFCSSTPLHCLHARGEKVDDIKKIVPDHGVCDKCFAKLTGGSKNRVLKILEDCAQGGH